MPQRKFRMLVSSKNTQTTANQRFNAERKKNTNFQMNAGCCGNRNPLIGWRKEILCCSGGKLNNYGYQTVLKNVQDCCKPPKLKMIQNRAGGASGAIDRNYNYNYRQYLKKRCKIADYDNRSGGRKKEVVDSNKRVLKAPCCVDCPANEVPNLHYKRKNWKFYGNDAVDNNLYIANKKLFANPSRRVWCCAPAPPLCVGFTVFVGSNDKKLHAVDAATGVARWTYTTGGRIGYSSPTVSPDGLTVFVGSHETSYKAGDSKLHAVDAATGVARWTCTADIVTPSTVAERRWGSSPTVSPDGLTVFVASSSQPPRPGGEKLYAIDAATGNKKWGYETDGNVFSSPTVSPDGLTVFVGSWDYKLHAVDAAAGTPEWKVETDGRVDSSPTVSADGLTVFVGSDDTSSTPSTRRRAPRSGSLIRARRWSRPPPCPPTVSPCSSARTTRSYTPSTRQRARRGGSLGRAAPCNRPPPCPPTVSPCSSARTTRSYTPSTRPRAARSGSMRRAVS